MRRLRMISLRFYTGLMLVLLLAMGTGSTRAEDAPGDESTTPGLASHILHEFESLASPGPLSEAHGALDQPDGCENCHEGAKGLRNRLCLACHEEVGERLKAGTGYHGTLKGNCYTCHDEHQGRDARLIKLDDGGFDHGKARFPLTGRHKALACDKCHLLKREGDKAPVRHYIGLPMECGQCHQSPHGDEFKQACTACHTTGGWALAVETFDHRQAAFPLQGRHRQVQCAQCHKDMKHFNLAPKQCAQCHADPHKGEFAPRRQCLDCHSEAGWKRPSLKFDHQTMTPFPLTGRHRRVDCDECHPGMKNFREASTECSVCHTDPHKGQFSPGKTCRDCHQTKGWTDGDLLFKHDADTRFPLTGLHRAVACAACHKDGRYHATPTQCAACHADPHEGAITQECTACHSTAGYGPDTLRFDHDRQTSFSLTGLHAIDDCQACHADRSYRVAGTQCTACHGDAEKFFAGALFPEIVPARPDMMHGRVRCEDCHKAADTRADAATVRPRCIACHNDYYGAYLDEAGRLIAGRLASLDPNAGTSDRLLGKPSLGKTSAIARYAAHNFEYAWRLLDGLETNPLGAGKTK